MIVNVTIDADPDWSPGPLPVRARSATRHAELLASGADQSARLDYFEPRVNEALYGTSARPTRWHAARSELLGACEVFGVEILRFPAAIKRDGGLAAVHVLLPQDPELVLKAVAQLARSVVAALETLTVALPPSVTAVPAQRQQPYTISHVTFSGEITAPLGPPYDAWPAGDQWAWLMASATPIAVFPPDPADTELFSGRVRFSRDWQGLVLRDGAAFIALTPDDGTDTTFHAHAQSYMHSIYLDIFILGRMQSIALNQLANRIALTRPHRLDAQRLASLEYDLADLRTIMWFSHITMRGRGNDLLIRFQQQNRLPQMFDRVVVDLEQAGRLVQAVTSRRVNAALGLLTIVGLPFGVAYAAGQLWSDGGAVLAAAWTAVALVLTVSLLVVPPLRGMLRAARRYSSEEGSDTRR